MKRQWMIKRQLQTTADEQKRWDQAYQLLLRVETPQSPSAEGSGSPVPQTLAPTKFYYTSAVKERYENDSKLTRIQSVSKP